MPANDKHSPYADMLDMEHPTSKRHPRMEREKRAAQFAPFAALTGYGDVIEETARYTESEIVLDENQKARLDQVLQELMQMDSMQMDGMQIDRPAIRLTYFVPDERKAGGHYATISGQISRVRPEKRMLYFESGEQILFEHIVDIQEV